MILILAVWNRCNILLSFLVSQNTTKAVRLRKAIQTQKVMLIQCRYTSKKVCSFMEINLSYKPFFMIVTVVRPPSVINNFETTAVKNDKGKSTAVAWR